MAGSASHKKRDAAPSLQGVHETAVYAEDLKAAKNFYGGVLGLTEITYLPQRMLVYRVADSIFLIFNPARTETERVTTPGGVIPLHGARGAGHMAFRVSPSDIADWRQRFQDCDVRIESEVNWPNGAHSLYFRDPAGNSLELATPDVWATSVNPSRESILMTPIGHVENTRIDLKEDYWGGMESRIVLTGSDPDALKGIEDFSHAEIIFLFDKVGSENVTNGARHPRNNSDWPEVGIYAQRAKNRPNRLGSTCAKILRREGDTLHVLELDAIHGTPVLDIKPVMAEFLPRSATRQPQWSHELMTHYWKSS